MPEAYPALVIDTETSGAVYAIRIIGRPKVYIGSTVDWPRRQSHHRWMLRAGKHHAIYLQRAVAKYGFDQVRMEVLETVPPSSLIEREQFWMDHFRGRLYNMAPLAGSNVGVRKTAAAKEKCAAFHRGRKRSAETRRRLSAAMFKWFAENGGRPRGSTANYARDAAIATAYFAAPSYAAVGPQFGIKAAAVFHANARFCRRLQSSLETASAAHIGNVLPRRIHPDWAELPA